MGKKYGMFKFSIGDVITSYGRNIEIIDRKYVQKAKNKNGIQFIANEKYYKYKCLECGNEDWTIEYSIEEKQHCGCNACCNPPRKVVKGVNDMATTAGWIIPLLKNKDDANKFHKYSKEKIEFVCPDCGRQYIKPIHNVISNKGLSCVCGDGISYPNKYMYSLLEQIGIKFETEKRFCWSDNRVYDFYIDKPTKIIIEMHGAQHYGKPIIKSGRYRSADDEQSNDKYKEDLARNNGVDNYYQIDCSLSDSNYIKDSISKTGLIEILGSSIEKIDWDLCDKFALSNLVKTVCADKETNQMLTLHDIADTRCLSYQTVLKYIKIGNKYGWCNYVLNSDRTIMESSNRTNRGQKPIYCQTNDMYYRDSNIASQSLSCGSNLFYPRQIRKAISRSSTYKGFLFSYLSQEEFNNIKSDSPSKVVGEFFNIKN